MGNVNMEASQINYRGGEKKMSVEEALKNTSGEAAAIAQLQTDVLNLNSNKANQITIAPFFNAEASYEVGDLVYYNGLSYRCTNAHDGEWDADDFAATTISGELDALKSGLTSVTDGLMSPISAVNKIAMSDANMANHDIGFGFTFADLVNLSHVTWFTNWDDNTNFPQKYGSGILIPGKDASQKAIIYICIGTNGGDVYTNAYTNNAWGCWRKLQFTS